MYRLCDLKIGESCRVKKLSAKGKLLNRFTDIGIIEDTVIKCEIISPQGDPKAYLIRGAKIAIRNKDAALILAGDDYG